MIDRARWVVAFLLRATADVLEDLADVVHPHPWSGAVPDCPLSTDHVMTPEPGRAALMASVSGPPFAADLVADHPPHLDPTED